MTQTTTNPALQDGLPKPQRHFAYATIIVTIAMSVLDGAIVNLALPIIAKEQAVSPSVAIWIITAYQLTIVVTLLPFAALSESLGFRKVYLAGVVMFSLASLLCAMAPNLPLLCVARVLQGLGGGAIMSINLAMVRQIMPQAKLGQGISGVSMIVGVAAAAGPSVGAAILAVASWHWLFLINVPLGILALIAGVATLPRIPGSGRKVNLTSALLNALMFGPLVLALGAMGHGDEPRGIIAAQLGVSVVACVLMVRRELKQAVPMLPVDLLKIQNFSQSLAATFFSFMGQFLALVTLPFFFHDLLGRSAAETGLLLTPWPVAAVIMAPIAGYLSDRVSADWLSGIGMVLFAGGLTTLALIPGDPGTALIMICLFFCGVGFGLHQSPNNRLLQSSVPRSRAGGASGGQSTMRLLGQSIGAALASMLLGVAGLDSVEPALLIAAGLAIVAGLCAMTRRSGNPRSVAAGFKKS